MAGQLTPSPNVLVAIMRCNLVLVLLNASSILSLIFVVEPDVNMSTKL